ncbi:hypothetical protein PoB_002376500 [Plakobranchus ocellatus]|uniref:OTU domain-containing protein n=1 Tax=Plakobranchus ocellatus TaxID=259542 RepID=A0AAV3ZQ36_9GAST|nr:hypothetical protein PoB_002376500 [Plakobranchus ocellatus]
MPTYSWKRSTLKHAKSDGTAEQILKIFHFAKLQGYKPLKVQADGNCFYRAVPLGCFGAEKFHTLLRMLSGIEVLLHPTAYDISHNEYIDIFEDPYLAHYSYDELCEGILKDSAYSRMLAVACTNSVIGNGIMTYCPPTTVPKLLSNPLTKDVRGRGLKESRECTCTVMWSMMICPKNISDFQPNHFVLLRKKSEIPNVFIDLTDVENEGHCGVDDEHQVHINKNDSDDGLFDDP